MTKEYDCVKLSAIFDFLSDWLIAICEFILFVVFSPMATIVTIITSFIDKDVLEKEIFELIK